MCFPTHEIITKQVKLAVKEYKAQSVFVSSDNDHMINVLIKALKRMEVNLNLFMIKILILIKPGVYFLQISVHKMPNPEPHVDLAILGRANYFIGNCISSFTAFAARERNVNGLPTGFWGFPPNRGSKLKREEL